MEKIKDLMVAGARGAGIPEKIDLIGGPLKLKFLVSGRILIPAIFMLVNINHYHAFGKPLIKVKGGLVLDRALPFGCRIDGDIELESTEYALGYILISITSAFKDIKPYIINSQIDEISLIWKEKILASTGSRRVVELSDYIDLPPPAQVL